MAAADKPASVVVHLDGKTYTVSWPRAAKLLDVLLAEGIDAPFSCQKGHCGACAVTKVAGEVEMENNEALDAEDLAEGLILACQARPLSDSIEVDYDD